MANGWGETDRLDDAVDGWKWTFVRDALESATVRFNDVLRTIPNPHAPAVGEWDIGDTAAHVSVVALLDSLLATGAPPPAGFEDVAARASTVTMAKVGDEVNRRSLEWEQRRDPRQLADSIAAEIDNLLRVTRDANGADVVRWLGGLPLPRSAVFGHLLSELLVHGYDIARASGRRFVIPPSEALRYFEGFMLEVVRNAPSVGFFDGLSRDVGDVRWELRLKGARPMRFEYVGGELRLASSATADVRISADPAAMLLVMYNRMAPIRPLSRGQLFVWGRRPWRLTRVTQVLQAP